VKIVCHITFSEQNDLSNILCRFDFCFAFKVTCSSVVNCVGHASFSQLAVLVFSTRQEVKFLISKLHDARPPSLYELLYMLHQIAPRLQVYM